MRYVKVITSAEDEVQMLLPHVKEAEQFMHLFGREYLVFDVSLQRSQVERGLSTDTLAQCSYSLNPFSSAVLFRGQTT